jgi:hypothetical protein
MKAPLTFNFLELEILTGFLRKQDELTSSFMKELDSHKDYGEREVYQQDWAGDIGRVEIQPIAYIAGLSDDEMDVDSAFTDIFPMYQRQAMLISLWSMFEVELTKFYYRVSSELDVNTEFKKLKQKSILFSLKTYFVELGLELEQSEEFKEGFKFLNDEVRHIRNDWVHNGGESVNSEKIGDIVGIDKVYSQLNISQDYLARVSKAMSDMGREISKTSSKLIQQHKAE